MPCSATEETSSHCTAQQTFEDISPAPTDQLSNLVDEHGEDSVENDEEYWKTPRNIVDSSGSEEGEGIILNTRNDKRCCGSSKHEEDHKWLYFSQSLKGWMCKVCEMYPYSTGPSMGAFSTRPCENTSHPSHVFKQHESFTLHKRLEKKLNDNSVFVYVQMVLGVEKMHYRRWGGRCAHTRKKTPSYPQYPLISYLNLQSPQPHGIFTAGGGLCVHTRKKPLIPTASPRHFRRWRGLCAHTRKKTPSYPHGIFAAGVGLSARTRKKNLYKKIPTYCRCVNASIQ